MIALENFDLIELLEVLEDSPPQVAKRICTEAIREVRLAAKKVDIKDLNKIIQAMFSMLVAEANNPGEFTKLAGDDLSHALDVLANPVQFGQLFRQEASKTHFRKFDENTTKHNDEVIDGLFSSCFLLIAVVLIKGAEDALFRETPSPTYAQTMAALDGPIYDLCQFYWISKTMIPSTEFAIQKLVEIEGAKKGGAAKGDKFALLKDIVLEEYDLRYRGKGVSRSTASLEIYERMKTHPDHKEELTNEHLKALSKNPPVLFAKWIGQYLKNSAEI